MTAFVPFVQKCLDSTGGSIHAFAATDVAACTGADLPLTARQAILGRAAPAFPPADFPENSPLHRP